MTGRILVVLSVLGGIAVMVYITVEAGTDLRRVANLLPVRIHVVAFLAFALDFVGRAARITFLADGVGHPVRFSTALYAMLAGEGAGAVTPSKAGADPAKAAVLNRDEMDLGTAGAVLAGEIISEAVMLLPIALLAVLFLPAGRLGALGALGYAVIVSAGVLVLFRLAGLSLREPPRWWLRVGLDERKWRILRVIARRFRHRSRSLLHLEPRTLFAVAFAALIHIIGRLAVLPALAWGHVEGAANAALVGWPFLLIYGGALIPTPGGGGAIEAGFAASLRGILEPSVLAGLLIWWRVYTFYLPAILGGVVLLLGGAIMGRRAAD